ncbi:MAG TPA: hypothetical protein PLO23_11470 [Alphaproteobacteria bacterium]|nr:hypothetical protein [Alphaproteobacteria bacterium]
MVLPFWAIFGFCAACLAATMMLLQERLKVNGYALAFWNKAACVVITLPFVLSQSLPTEPLFYVFVFLTAILYAISDVAFFTTIPKTDAGAVSRLVPSATVLGFLLWFVIDPGLALKYLDKPLVSGLILLVLCLFAFFGFRLKKCHVTLQTLRGIWFVIFAATVGPMLSKMVTFHAGPEKGIAAYVFFQAGMMMVLWLAFLFLRKPVPIKDFFAPATWKPALVIGCVSAGMVLLKFTSFYYVDNPAYIPAILALDSVIILAVYKLWGKKAEGDVASGLGIVACAAALIILKTYI